jgi:ATP-dependent HslUV protease ATP-binding subunit HslU
MIQLNDVLGKFGNENRKKTLQMSVKDAMTRIVEEESISMIDEDSIVRDSLENVTNNGIIFIDEIDKLISSAGS